MDANLYNEQLCLGVAHGLANAAENGDGITVTPIMQDQPQQIRIPILPYGHCLCKRQDQPCRFCHSGSMYRPLLYLGFEPGQPKAI